MSMKRLTKEICGYAHGAEGISEDKLTGSYCRGEFEATARQKLGRCKRGRVG